MLVTPQRLFPLYLVFYLLPYSLLFGDEQRVILIIGDSVTHRQQPYIREILPSPLVKVINVNTPGSSYDSFTMLEKIDEWLVLSDRIDAIYFNVGLWDIRNAGDYSPTPLDIYRCNLEVLVEKFKETGARVIFGTTTPVKPPANFNRQNEDVEAINQVATRVMKEHGVTVNDMHSFVRLDTILSDGIHFSDEMCREMAKRTARYLRGSPTIRIDRKAGEVSVFAWPGTPFVIESSCDMISWIPGPTQLSDSYSEFPYNLDGNLFLRVRLAYDDGFSF